MLRAGCAFCMHCAKSELGAVLHLFDHRRELWHHQHNVWSRRNHNRHVDGLLFGGAAIGDQDLPELWQRLRRRERVHTHYGVWHGYAELSALQQQRDRKCLGFLPVALYAAASKTAGFARRFWHRLDHRDDLRKDSSRADWCRCRIVHFNFFLRPRRDRLCLRFGWQLQYSPKRRPNGKANLYGSGNGAGRLSGRCT
jgi:hypothetical protein